MWDVVFLSQRVPWPPDRGDRITTHHVLRHFLRRGDRVRVGCLAGEARDSEGIGELAREVDEICAPRIHPRARQLASMRGLLTGEPLTLPFFRSRRLQAAVDRWMRERPPDVVWMYSSSMAQYVARWPEPVRFMQFAELDSDKWRQYAAAGGPLARWIYRREARRLLEFERRVARSFDVSGVVSEVERELFESCIPDVDPVVVPNGVDVEHFSSRGDGERDPHTVVFTGVMDYPPNVDGVSWFVDECWPAVRGSFGDARLMVVGSRPTAAVRALAQRPGVEVTGRVPATPPYFDRAAVAIAPLRLARGVQNKVLEAMSMALPVVATPQASRGLAGVPPDALVVAEGREETTAAVCGLLADPVRARGVGQRAARFVREHFRWERVLARLDAAVEEASARRRARSSSPDGSPGRAGSRRPGE